MPNQHHPDKQQAKFWLHRQILADARHRAAQLGETVTDAVTRFLIDYGHEGKDKQ